MTGYLRDTVPYLIVASVILALYLGVVEVILRKNKSEITHFQRMGLFLLGIYLTIIFSVTVSPIYGLRWNVDWSDVNIVPGQVFTSSENGLNLWGNILMFVPVGFAISLLSSRWKKYTNCIVFGLCTSFIIETMQLFLDRGTDIDDLILNTIGTLVGCIVTHILVKCFSGLNGATGITVLKKKRKNTKHAKVDVIGEESIKKIKGIESIKDKNDKKEVFDKVKKTKDGKMIVFLALGMLMSVVITGSWERYECFLNEGGKSFLEAGATGGNHGVTTVSYHSTESDKRLTALQLKTKYVYVANATSKEELFSSNKTTRIAPASTTKMVTALTVLKYCDLDETVKVGEELSDVAADASKAGLARGNTLTVKQLLEGLLLPSGNDAAYVLAVHTGQKIAGTQHLSVETAISIFVEKMNETAKTVGAEDSNFCRPDGYDEEGQYSTVYDLACIATAFLNADYNNGFLKKTVAKKKIREVFSDGTDVTWVNTNALLDTQSSYYYKNAIGLKTGNSDNAGKCLVSAANINNKLYICVVMGDTEDGRYQDTLKIYRTFE